MDVRDFDFDLPTELIAQVPAGERTAARLLHLDRQTGSIAHATIASLCDRLRAGDLLVVNNTRVFPARLLGRRLPGGGAVECVLVRRLGSDRGRSGVGPGSDWGRGRSGVGPGSDWGRAGVGLGSELKSEPKSGLRSELTSGPGSKPEAGTEVDAEIWEALVHPGQKLHPGARMVFEGVRTVHCDVLEQRFFGRRVVRLWTADGTPVDTAVDAIGHIPLPPYIKRADAAEDRDRYQTVYARDRGSIAAPTAGLHFTPSLMSSLADRGVQLAEITLHVGYGTFQPVRVDRVEDHRLEAEPFTIGDAAATAINTALDERRRVLAVGTTTTRTLEAVALTHNGRIASGSGTTDLFIYPGFAFSVISGLLTNFHLPQSSLLMLVSAFAGRDRVLAAYRAAIAARYRFYSYGDAMLIT